MSLESITNEEWGQATEGFGTAEQRAETANLIAQGRSSAEARAASAQQAAQQVQAAQQAKDLQEFLTHRYPSSGNLGSRWFDPKSSPLINRFIDYIRGKKPGVAIPAGGSIPAPALPDLTYDFLKDPELATANQFLQNQLIHSADPAPLLGPRISSLPDYGVVDPEAVTKAASTNLYGLPRSKPDELTKAEIDKIGITGDTAERYGLTPTSKTIGGAGPGGRPSEFAFPEHRIERADEAMGAKLSPVPNANVHTYMPSVQYNKAGQLMASRPSYFSPDVVGEGKDRSWTDDVAEFFTSNKHLNPYGKYAGDYGVPMEAIPEGVQDYRDIGAGDIVSMIASTLANPLLGAKSAWDISNRAAPTGRSQVNMNPAEMGYGTKELYGVDVPQDTWDRGLNPDLWESGGNVEAIRRFLQDPTHANIPEVDPMSALTAYENAIGGIDALVGERGFTGQGYAQAARDRTQGIFDKFLPGQDVDALLNEKIGRAFAEEALTAKGSEFRQQGVQAIEQSFPEGFASDIFNPEAFSKVAENIYGQKLGGAQDIIARAGARGQLSPRGGRLASESLLSQGPDVRSGISDVISGVRSGLEGGLQGIRGSALEQAQGYQLGDELFDVTPFETQATDYLKSSLPGIESDISGAIGTDPLFSAVSALQEGGRQQGQVSGTPSFLDVLAEREGGIGAGRDRRGLGSRGSGVF